MILKFFPFSLWTVVDISTVLFFFICLLTGYLKGFLQNVLFFIGIFVGLFFLLFTENFFSFFSFLPFKEPEIRLITSISLFFAGFFLCQCFIRFIPSFPPSFHRFDKWAGLFFGGIKATCIIGGLSLLSLYFSLQAYSFRKAVLFPQFGEILQTNILPYFQ